MLLVIALENVARGLDVNEPHALIVDDGSKELYTVDWTASVFRLAHSCHPCVMGFVGHRDAFLPEGAGRLLMVLDRYV
jgi:hypothetical protein